MPIQILHAADFHLDAPFASLNAEQAAERRGEQRELLARLAELARSRGADLVLLSGDLFDGGELYAETGQALVRTLGQTGCPVFIAPGNHDFYSARSPYARLAWPDNVHLFRRAGLTPVELEGKACTVWGAAFTAPAREDSPLAGFAAPADGRLHLGVLHGDVEGRGRYGPIGPEEIAASGLTYLALGHIHARSGLRRAGETFWAYPGCPEGRGFDELGDKGCLWITVRDDGGVEEEFVPLARRRYRVLEADVSGPDPAAALEYIKDQGKYPAVIKADGLALGKGVIIAQNEEEAKAALHSIMEDKIFGESGAHVVVEEFLTGPEVSVLAFTDG